eukprot:scaffold991_cov278-Amphora_coffeaeformis.AAC.4
MVVIIVIIIGGRRKWRTFFFVGQEDDIGWCGVDSFIFTSSTSQKGFTQVFQYHTGGNLDNTSRGWLLLLLLLHTRT